VWVVDQRVYPKDCLSFTSLILLQETPRVVGTLSTDERAVNGYKLMGPGVPKGGLKDSI